MARQRATADGVDAERLRRSDHLEHGDRAQHERLGRCLRRWIDAFDPGHLRLLRAVDHSSTRKHSHEKPHPSTQPGWGSPILANVVSAKAGYCTVRTMVWLVTV